MLLLQRDIFKILITELLSRGEAGNVPNEFVESICAGYRP
jgi:hypothetical protein